MPNKLSNDVSFDDIEYEIYVLDEIREGIVEADRGDLIDHDEVKARMASGWENTNVPEGR